MNNKTRVGDTYDMHTPEQQRAFYDDWANNYEQELCAMGYRLPAAAAAVFTRYVPAGSGPILDAGCGGGIQIEPLVQIGYGPFIGIDLSDGMLDVARGKGLYAELYQTALGGPLDFPDDKFAAVYSIGTITPKHAPAESFDELIRVVRTGGLVVFSLRNDAAQEPEYPAALARHTDAGNWGHVFSTEGFHSMPYGEPDITHQIHVYRKL